MFSSLLGTHEGDSGTGGKKKGRSSGEAGKREMEKKKLTSHMEKTLKGLLLHWFLMLSGLDGFVLVVVDYLQQFTLL